MNRTRRSRRNNAISNAIDSAFDWLREKIRGTTGFLRRPPSKAGAKLRKVKSHPSLSKRQTSATSTKSERRINKSTGKIMKITIDNEDTIKIKDNLGMVWNSSQANNRPLGNPITNDPEFGWWAPKIMKYKIDMARLIIQPIAATSQSITYDEEGDGIMTPIYLPRIKFLLSTRRTMRLPLGLEFNPVTYVLNPNLPRVQVQNYTFHNSLLFDQVNFDWCAPNVEYFDTDNTPYLYISGNFANSAFVDNTVIAKVRVQYFITAVVVDTMGNGIQSKQTSLSPLPPIIPEENEEDTDKEASLLGGNSLVESTLSKQENILALSNNINRCRHRRKVQSTTRLQSSIQDSSSQFAQEKEFTNDA